MTIRAVGFNSANEAIQHYYASGYGDHVVMLGGCYYVTTRAEADRLAATGVEFAYVFDRDRSDGRNVLVTVPVN